MQINNIQRQFVEQDETHDDSGAAMIAGECHEVIRQSGSYFAFVNYLVHLVFYNTYYLSDMKKLGSKGCISFRKEIKISVLFPYDSEEYSRKIQRGTLL